MSLKIPLTLSTAPKTDEDLVMIHFKTMIGLMMFFFLTFVILSIAGGIWNLKNLDGALVTSHDYFITFAGIAVGMFRGMNPGTTNGVKPLTHEPPVPPEPLEKPPI